MESKPAEFRLNTFKNFNHLNQDREGAMEIFGQRVNTEIQRMSGEVFDDGDGVSDDGNVVTDNNEIELSTDIEELDNIDMDNPTEDKVDGLTINSDEQAIPRQHSYPYGFGTQPSPSTKNHTGIKSKTGSPILTFEEFKWDNVTIKNKKIDKDFLNKIVPKLKKKLKS